jgi:hypothetical protein
MDERSFITGALGCIGTWIVCNLGGTSAHARDVVAAIEAAEPGSCGHINFGEQPLARPTEAAPAHLPAELDALPEVPRGAGVAQTMELFKAAPADGLLSPPR